MEKELILYLSSDENIFKIDFEFKMSIHLI